MNTNNIIRNLAYLDYQVCLLQDRGSLNEAQLKILASISADISYLVLQIPIDREI